MTAHSPPDITNITINYTKQTHLIHQQDHFCHWPHVSMQFSIAHDTHLQLANQAVITREDLQHSSHGPAVSLDFSVFHQHDVSFFEVCALSLPLLPALKTLQVFPTPSRPECSRSCLCKLPLGAVDVLNAEVRELFWRFTHFLCQERCWCENEW